MAHSAALQLKLTVQRVPVDPVRNHQQHLHEILQRLFIRHRLAVDDLYVDLYPLDICSDVAIGEEGSPGDRAVRSLRQLRGHVDQSGQRPAKPVLGHYARTVHLLLCSGVHFRDAVSGGVRVVRFR